MTLVQLNFDLGRVADALDRIVFLLEKLAFPPVPDKPEVYQATLDDLHIITPEDVARIHEEQEEFAARYNVVPGSEAYMQAILDWEESERNLHGENWQPPQDWRAIFAEAERGRGHSTSSAPAQAANRSGE